MAVVYFFGCEKQAGHFMKRNGPDFTLEDRRKTCHFTERNPWGHNIDSGLCPKDSDVQGRAIIHHKDQWTALSFWDRSVDRRGGSNSNFLAEGTHTFDEMVAIAKENFPEIMARFNFPIVEVK